tara:strand:- start:24445 stop:24966 length:522 start_codon:yes stop_codon:yes gene_type:complete
VIDRIRAYSSARDADARRFWAEQGAAARNRQTEDIYDSLQRKIIMGGSADDLEPAARQVANYQIEGFKNPDTGALMDLSTPESANRALRTLQQSDLPERAIDDLILKSMEVAPEGPIKGYADLMSRTGGWDRATQVATYGSGLTAAGAGLVSLMQNISQANNTAQQRENVLTS